MKELRDVDLNLMVVFRELLATGNVSAAAERLGVSQSAASNALARLRAIFDDELFVRAGGAMQPTTLAQQLAAPVNTALSLLHDSLQHKDFFDPGSTSRRFHLAMTDVGEVYFMPRLLAYCRAHAPGVRLSVVHANGSALRAALQEGGIDLVVGPFDDMPEGLFQQFLFRQSCVTLCRPDHPLAQEAVDLAEFRKASHLFVPQAFGPYRQIQQRMEKAGIHVADHDQIPSLLAAPFAVARSDHVVTVPQKLAEQFAAPLGLIQIDPPLRLPMLRTHVFWHRRFHQDAGNRWLRGVIGELFTERKAGTRM